MKNSSFIDINNVEILEIPDTKNNKRGSIKILVIILIMILILLFGVGLYFFLRYAKETTKEIKINDKVVELGTKINRNVEDYVDGKNCKIDFSNIKENDIGKYKYTVKCSKKNYFGYIVIKDTTRPIVTTKIVNILPNEEFNIQQFILNSYDLTKLEYKYDSDFDIVNYNKSIGLYILPIHAIDTSKNETNVNGVLIVSSLKAEKYLSATKYASTNYNATLTTTDKIGINSSNYYVNSLRIYEYVFNGKEEYNKAKEEYNTTNEIDNITGNVVFDDAENKITIYKLLNKSELDLLNGNFPYTYSEINSLYNRLGYNLKIESNN